MSNEKGYRAGQGHFVKRATIFSERTEAVGDSKFGVTNVEFLTYARFGIFDYLRPLKGKRFLSEVSAGDVYEMFLKANVRIS